MSIHEDKPKSCGLLLGSEKERKDRQEALDYGFDFARNWFHGQVVALLAGKIDRKLLKEVERIFK